MSEEPKDELEQDLGEQPLVNVTIDADLKEKLNGESTQVIMQAINDYAQKYGTPRNSVEVKLGDFSPKIQVRADGSQWLVVPEEQAAKGVIYIDPVRSRNLTNLRNMIAHACTHALKSDLPRALEPQIPITSEIYLYGIHGFALVVEPLSNKTLFEKLIYVIEEGACEALASNLYVRSNQPYSTNDRVYFNLGRLTNALLDISGITHIELASMVQNNGLFVFVRKVLNVKKVSRDDLLFTLNAFNNVMNGVDPQGVYNLIVQRRKSK